MTERQRGQAAAARVTTTHDVRRADAVPRGGLGLLIARYSQHRGLSETQGAVLQRHFAGVHDKEIASELRVSVTTVHEHWRRIARKTECRTKADVLADVYLFLSSQLEQGLS